MLARLTADDQLALPKALLASFPGVDCFSVTEENGRIVLSPLRLSRADEVRRKLEELGVTEADVKDAVAWARCEFTEIAPRRCPAGGSRARLGRCGCG